MRAVMAAARDFGRLRSRAIAGLDDLFVVSAIAAARAIGSVRTVVSHFRRFLTATLVPPMQRLYIAKSSSIDSELLAILTLYGITPSIGEDHLGRFYEWSVPSYWRGQRQFSFDAAIARARYYIEQGQLTAAIE